jgi:DsbC/DsbD-like thiol-disulfide interchange protein
MAGIELALADGWKTYWRMPGDSGGVPPHFDWQASQNLKSATVLFPAPSRLTDPTGDAIGYKRQVVFPVEIDPVEPAKPIVLALQMEYGICREICVPAEAKLEITLPPGIAPKAPAALAAAVERVPLPVAVAGPTAPRLEKGVAKVDANPPTIELTVAFPGGTEGADLFVEAPDGIYLPLPKRTGEPARWALTFEVDIANGVDIKEILGKTLTLTAVSASGQSEMQWAMPN